MLYTSFYKTSVTSVKRKPGLTCKEKHGFCGTIQADFPANLLRTECDGQEEGGDKIEDDGGGAETSCGQHVNCETGQVPVSQTDARRN